MGLVIPTILRWRYILPLLIVFVLGPASINNAAADSVVVRAGVHKDFGRLVFDWQKQVGFSAVIEDRTLSVRFDRTIDPKFGKIVQDLGPYISGVKLAEDKQTVLVSLKNDFKVRTSEIGSLVVVDLVKLETPSIARGTKKVGAASKATRVKKQNTAKSVTAKKTVAASNDDEQLLPVKTGHHKNYGRLVFGWPRTVGYVVNRQGRNVTIKFDRAAKLDIAKLRRDLPRQISSAVQQSSNKGLHLELIVPADAQLRYFHNNTDIVFDVVTTREKVAVRKAPRSRVRKPVNKKKRKKKSSQKNYPFVSVNAVQSDGELTFRFNWRQPVSAAVLRRDSSLWIHFDQPARLEMGQIQVVGNSRFRNAQQKNLKNSVHLRLPIPGNARTKVQREGTVWVVTIGPKRKQGIRPFPLTVRNKAGKGTELLIKVDNPGAVSVIRDEVVGDAFYAVPAYRTGRGMTQYRRFPDFELLSSPQGLAVRPLSDSLRVNASPTGIVVTKPGGLNISPEAVATLRRTPNGKDRKLIDLAAWRHGPIGDFKKIEHELVQYVTQPKGVRRNAARMGLAKFYLAHGMGVEALGVLNTLLKDSPEVMRDNRVRALRGLAQYLTGHYAEADADLSHHSLAGIRELYPWRAGIAAARGDWAGAYQLFVDTDIVLATLPSEFAVKLGLLAAEASLSVQEKEIAQARLGAVESLGPVGGQLDQLAYLNGHLLKLKGDTSKALALWETVAAEGVRPVRGKATFARINTLLESKAIKIPEAIKQLQSLQFAWRNSVFEYDLLNKLGDLHAKRRNLRSALVTLREAVTLFRNIKGAQSLTQRMRDLFRKFYLEGEADYLQPVVALGLYNEFRELTPTGSDGDKMIRLLAERLIKVDLLEDAAKLLDHQIRFRLKDEERSQTGARLAEISLLDGKPQAALAALAASEHSPLAAPLSEKRRHLEAAALMDSKRYDEALSNIAEDFSEEFDILRAQIYWRAGNWQKASRVLARLTGNVDAGKLKDQDAQLLLRRAVALGLANDFEGMQFLRDRFGAAMEKSKQAASFKAVAGGKLLKARNFAALARRAAELDTFRAFMKNLGQRRVKSGSGQTTVLN